MAKVEEAWEILGIPDIERRLQLGEDSRWEFKRVGFAGNRPKSPKRDDWADEIAAFANTDGGVVLCGVADDGMPQGMSRKQIDALDSLLVEICTDSIKPPVRIRSRRKELSGGERILLLEVPRSDSQHDSPGGSYVRVGGSKRPMSPDERARLAQRRGQALYRWFDEQAVGGHGVRNTGRNALETAVERRGRSESRGGAPEARASGARRKRRRARDGGRSVAVYPGIPNNGCPPRASPRPGTGERIAPPARSTRRRLPGR